METNIFSLSDENERECLRRLAKEVPAGGTIIEIGSLYGGMTAVLAIARPEARVITIDDFSWHPEGGEVTSAELVMVNMEKVGAENVSVLKGESREIGRAWDRPVDLTFIDGGHSFEFVYPDLCNFAKFSKVVALHDYDNPAWGTIRQAVEKFLSKNKEWMIAEITGMVCVLRKKPSDEAESLSRIFENIYRTNAWASTETISGGGSELNRTEEIRLQLIPMLEKFQIKSLLDAGCGDWNWMSKLDLSKYAVLACDIVPEVIRENEKEYKKKASFFVADITRDELPKVGLIICRATLFHLSLKNAKRAIENMKRSASYLLLTTHPATTVNEDIRDGEWRRLNLEIAPFSMGTPEFWFYDGPGMDGCAGVWRTQ